MQRRGLQKIIFLYRLGKDAPNEVQAESSNEDTDPRLALALEMTREVGEALFGCQPFGEEEANLLKGRYERIREKLIGYEDFVKVEESGDCYFHKGFNFKDFENLLLFQLSEIACKWNACPLCTAGAIVMLPRLIERYVHRMNNHPPEKLQLIYKNRYNMYFDINMLRKEENSYKYRISS